MKTYSIIVVASLIFMIATTSSAQTSTGTKKGTLKTETIKVGGSCESCKARIEKAAKVDGVSEAEWNIETKLLSLVYDTSKVSNDQVQKKIAAVGHDTEKYKADDKTYNSLPGCCKYR